MEEIIERGNIGVTIKERDKLFRVNAETELRIRVIPSVDTIKCGNVTFPGKYGEAPLVTTEIVFFEDQYWRQQPLYNGRTIADIPGNSLNRLRHNGGDSVLLDKVELSQDSQETLPKRIREAEEGVIFIDGKHFVRCGEPCWEVHKSKGFVNVQPGFLPKSPNPQTSYFQIDNQTDAMAFGQVLADEIGATLYVQGSTDDFTQISWKFNDMAAVAMRFETALRKAIPIIALGNPSGALKKAIDSYLNDDAMMSLSKIDNAEDFCAVLESEPSSKAIQILLDQLDMVRRQCRYYIMPMSLTPTL